MIKAEHLTKRYGSTVAVDDVSFAVEPGRVTGFLGPNGAGKSTTMRMILGLDTPRGQGPHQRQNLPGTEPTPEGGGRSARRQGRRRWP